MGFLKRTRLFGNGTENLLSFNSTPPRAYPLLTVSAPPVPQVQALAGRLGRHATRHPLLMGLNLVAAAAMALGIGAIFWDTGRDTGGIQARAGKAVGVRYTGCDTHIEVQGDLQRHVLSALKLGVIMNAVSPPLPSPPLTTRLTSGSLWLALLHAALPVALLAVFPARLEGRPPRVLKGEGGGGLRDGGLLHVRCPVRLASSQVCVVCGAITSKLFTAPE